MARHRWASEPAPAALATGLLIGAFACGGKVTVVDDSGFLGELTGTGGNDMSEACYDCIRHVDDDSCSAVLAACKADDICEHYLKCQKHCGWAEVCETACATQFPVDVPLFIELPQCFVCTHCDDPCQSWWVHGLYCDGAAGAGGS